jgi:hypothetical protein
METKHILGFLAAIIVLVGGIAFIAGKQAPAAPATNYDLTAFAQCLKTNGATFYGAFWCPHCQATKKIFGTEATKELPYVECSTADGRGQLPICVEKGIKTYPTWIFADGSELNGELTAADAAGPGFISLADLSSKTNCPLIPTDGSAPIYPTPTTATSTNATSTTSHVIGSSTTSQATSTNR